MNKGETITFSQMFGKFETAQIPVIQRDYAQGREGATEVRRQFLAALRTSLTENKPSQPLNLDFVYGSFEEENKQNFSILDGQQRLTTLFLLHWYLASKEGVLKEFRNTFVAGESSRFTYKTRTSASEFFDALAMAEDVNPNNLSFRLSDSVVDKSWFMLSWEADPTVHSCLNMLDAIHNDFFQCPDGSYARLTDPQSPRITFQFLDLEDFGLSDELYIKMNARGRPLTEFENFKAWLCGQLEHIAGGKALERKLDREWTELFWHLSRQTDDKSTFDQLYLRFFNLMAFYRACDREDIGYAQMDDSAQRWLSFIRSPEGHVPADDLEKHGSHDEANIRRVELVLDYFHALFQSNESLEDLLSVLTSNDYVRQARFYALVRFIESMTPEVGEAQEELRRWRRVTNNLINNHRIDEMPSFVPAVQSLNRLSEHCSDLYESIAVSGIKGGFPSSQREEEQLKANLILKNPDWEASLERFEGHVYLKGKLGFLLEMATEEDSTLNRQTFEGLASKVASLLSDEIRASKDYLLERALLSLGNYLPLQSNYRYSFCLPNRGTFRERQENWFRVVSKPEFRTLLSHINGETEASLKELISRCDCDDWRQLVVENPDAIQYCEQRIIHRHGDHVCLLSKATFKGYHAELRTFVLDHKLQQLQKEKGLPEEIRSFSFHPVYGAEEWSYNKVELNNGRVYAIYYDYEGFTAEVRKDPEGTWVVDEIPSVLKDLILMYFPGSTVR